MTGDPASAITRGALRSIIDAGDGAASVVQDPIVQCLQVKPTPNAQGGPERFRVVFSDINNFIQSMIATMLDLDVLEEYGEYDKIGQPVGFEEIKTEDGPQQPQQQPGNISGNNFYGNRPQQQPTPTHSNAPARTNGPSAMSASHANLYPIEALSPYQHKWSIKVRCTNKSDIKKWHNRNGEGKLFNVTFLDQTGEIRATGFNDQCDTLYDVFQEGQIYYISTPCRVQMAKKQYSNVNNDYELTFERDTVVEKAEDQDDVPQVRYNFTSIGDLQNVEKDTLIDTIGILKEVGEVSQIVSKTTSKPFEKRELNIVDNTGYSVRLTIWGSSATSFDAPEESVVAFKGVKVGDFGGRSLSLLSSGSMSVNPDIDDAHRLKGWYDAAGRYDNYSTHQSALSSTTGSGRNQQYKTIQQIKEENIGMGEETEYFTLKGTVVFVRQESFSYPACLSEGCNKKVIEEDPGQWRCVRCEKVHPKPQYRYIISVNVSDHTGQLWISGFDDAGKLIMGMSADDLQEIVESGDEAKKRDVFQEASCNNYVFRCRAKMENYADQTKVRYNIMNISPVNYSSEANRLAEIIKSYNIGSDSLFVQ
ncbi:MAG: Replication factor A protein 1 [Bogoriella megaspora]|nr:MAG: Replication factor A protein 1 [Bogoriella megaspora]